MKGSLEFLLKFSHKVPKRASVISLALLLPLCVFLAKLNSGYKHSKADKSTLTEQKHFYTITLIASPREPLQEENLNEDRLFHLPPTVFQRQEGNDTYSRQACLESAVYRKSLIYLINCCFRI